MPHYEFYCEKCEKEVTLTLSIAERERGAYTCPACRGKALRPAAGHIFLPDVEKSLNRASMSPEGLQLQGRRP